MLATDPSKPPIMHLAGSLIAYPQTTFRKTPSMKVRLLATAVAALLFTAQAEAQRQRSEALEITRATALRGALRDVPREDLEEALRGSPDMSINYALDAVGVATGVFGQATSLSRLGEAGVLSALAFLRLRRVRKAGFLSSRGCPARTRPRPERRKSCSRKFCSRPFKPPSRSIHCRLTTERGDMRISILKGRSAAPVSSVLKPGCLRIPPGSAHLRSSVGTQPIAGAASRLTVRLVATRS